MEDFPQFRCKHNAERTCSHILLDTSFRYVLASFSLSVSISFGPCFCCSVSYEPVYPPFWFVNFEASRFVDGQGERVAGQVRKGKYEKCPIEERPPPNIPWNEAATRAPLHEPRRTVDARFEEFTVHAHDKTRGRKRQLPLSTEKAGLTLLDEFSSSWFFLATGTRGDSEIVDEPALLEGMQSSRRLCTVNYAFLSSLDN